MFRPLQAVAVCLEKGDSVSARSALKWLREEHLFPAVSDINMVFVASFVVLSIFPENLKFHNGKCVRNTTLK